MLAATLLAFFVVSLHLVHFLIVHFKEGVFVSRSPALVDNFLQGRVTEVELLFVLRGQVRDDRFECVLLRLDVLPVLRRVGFEHVLIKPFLLSLKGTLPQIHLLISESHEEELCLFDLHVI